MKKPYLLLMFLILTAPVVGQVGVGNANPHAQLDITASNTVTPANTDGILIPRIAVFPATAPTANQNGMLVFLTNTVGVNLPGFYYWDNATTAWLPIKGNNGGTLDQAYDFGGAGLGKTITADAGAVLINGSDGLVSTGTLNNGALMPTGSGVRMVWNPRKAAFRAGLASFDFWDDTQVGLYSVAFGRDNIASGNNAVALGHNSIASGNRSVTFGYGTEATADVTAAFGYGSLATAPGATSFGFSTHATSNQSTAFGYLTTASGQSATAFGYGSTASGYSATAFGSQTTASGIGATAFGNGGSAAGWISTTMGLDNAAAASGEVVLGIGSTAYTPSVNGATQFRTANATDRLFTIGNAIDTNNNNTVDPTERRDAMTVLKNGLTRLPSTTNAMINAADGKAVVTKEYIQANTSGTLDQAYDFGGGGAGRTITADTGAVLINGTDGLVATGTFNNGAVSPTGAGTRMVWNPRKAAFRAGTVPGNEWDDANVGNYSVSFGNGNVSSGQYSASFGNLTDATAESSTAFGGYSDATGQYATAFGQSTLASGYTSTAFGYFCTANAMYATAFGYNSRAMGRSSTAFGDGCDAVGNISTAFGYNSTANGNSSIAFGFDNTAPSFGETVLGIGATTYTPSANGATQFRTANATDRLFTIGNAIDTNNDGAIAVAERSDAMVVLKNGNVGFGTSTPQDDVVISGGAGRTTLRIVNTSTIGASSNASVDFFRQSNANTDWRIGNNGPNLNISSSDDDLASVTHVYQFQNARFIPMEDATISLGQAANRWSVVYASFGFINTSDARQKKNIKNLHYGLKDLMKLRPVSFEWNKDDESGTKLGLIAQELQQVVPEVVRDWEWQDDGNGQRKKVAAPLLGVFYSDLIPVLIKSVQEQQTLIESQKTENDHLKKQLETQAQTLSSLLSRIEKLESKN